MIRIIQYDSSEVTSRDDRAFYEQIVAQSGIFYGCGITHLGANQISISDGRGIASGANFSIEDETVNVELSTSGQAKGRLYIRIDLNNAQTPIEILSIVANTLPELTQEDLGKDGQVYEMALAEYDVSTSAISNIIDKRNMLAPVSEQKYTDIALYVSTTGSDDTGDGTEAAPFASVNHAISQIPTYVKRTQIYIYPGTYNENIVVWNGEHIWMSAQDETQKPSFQSIEIYESYDIRVVNLKFTDTGAASVGSDTQSIMAYNSSCIITTCELTASQSILHGVYAYQNSGVVVRDCVINGYNYGVSSYIGASLKAQRCSGTNGGAYYANAAVVWKLANNFTSTGGGSLETNGGKVLGV